MADIQLKFFARLREELQTEALSLPADDVKNLDQLIPYLVEKYPAWKPFLQKSLLTAVNQEMIQGDVKLSAGDEVALFPPVTGG